MVIAREEINSDKFISEFDDFVIWLESLGIKTSETRIGYYQRKLQRAEELWPARRDGRACLRRRTGRFWPYQAAEGNGRRVLCLRGTPRRPARTRFAACGS